MPGRAAQLIATLRLQPHPEGGHFRRIFTSAQSIDSGDDRGRRVALTTIHYLLRAGEQSRLHRVRSDEVWHFHEGEALELTYFDAEITQPTRQILGPVSGAARPVAAVPAGCWQCAAPLGDYTLVSCSVAPGFEYTDFQLMEDCPDAARRLRQHFPDWRSRL